MRDTVLFDLDNTLFDVEQYMTGAFDDVAAHLSAEHAVDREDIRTDLLNLWQTKTSMYPHLFDDVIDERNIDADIDRIVTVFNDHEPEIEPYDGVPELLNRLQQTGYTLGVITDGTARRQRRKLDTLGIHRAFETVVLTDELGEPKPSPVPFAEAVRRLDQPGCKCVYVGDNPRVDFAGAKQMDMYTIRLHRGEYRHLPSGTDVDSSVGHIGEVYDIVAGI